VRDIEMASFLVSHCSKSVVIHKTWSKETSLASFAFEAASTKISVHNCERIIPIMFLALWFYL